MLSALNVWEFLLKTFYDKFHWKKIFGQWTFLCFLWLWVKLWDTVISIRKNPPAKKVRIFNPPPINWELNYIDYIGKEWKLIEGKDTKEMTEPPVFMHLTDEDLQRAVDDPEAVLKLLNYNQHTQPTELMVQKMAKASSYFYSTIYWVWGSAFHLIFNHVPFKWY